MKSMKRSTRRHHNARIKNNWYHYLLNNSFYFGTISEQEDWARRWSRCLVTTHTQCSSCLGHINPRVYDGITLQERRNMLSFGEEIEHGIDR